MKMNQHGMKSTKNAILVPQFEISLADLGSERMTMYVAYEEKLH